MASYIPFGMFSSFLTNWRLEFAMKSHYMVTVLKTFICFSLTFSIVVSQFIQPAAALSISPVLSILGTEPSIYLANTHGAIHRHRHHPVRHHSSTGNRPHSLHEPHKPAHSATHHSSSPALPSHHRYPQSPSHTPHLARSQHSSNHGWVYPKDLPVGVQTVMAVCTNPKASNTQGSLGGKFSLFKLKAISGKGTVGNGRYEGGGCFSSIQIDTQYAKTKLATDTFQTAFQDTSKVVEKLGTYGIAAGVAQQLISAVAEARPTTPEQPSAPCKPVSVYVEETQTFYEVPAPSYCLATALDKAM